MKQKKTGIIILSLIIAAMLIPVLIGCKYAIPSADDFKSAGKTHLIIILYTSSKMHSLHIWNGREPIL